MKLDVYFTTEYSNHNYSTKFTIDRNVYLDDEKFALWRRKSISQALIRLYDKTGEFFIATIYTKGKRYRFNVRNYICPIYCVDRVVNGTIQSKLFSLERCKERT